MVEDKPICAFCNNVIEEEDEVFIVGTKAKEGVNLQEYEGQMIQLPCSNMFLPVVVTRSNSKARQDGYDLLFLVCSYGCMEKLKDLLKAEMDFVAELTKLQ